MGSEVKRGREGCYFCVTVRSGNILAQKKTWGARPLLWPAPELVSMDGSSECNAAFRVQLARAPPPSGRLEQLTLSWAAAHVLSLTGTIFRKTPGLGMGTAMVKLELRGDQRGQDTAEITVKPQLNTARAWTGRRWVRTSPPSPGRLSGLQLSGSQRSKGRLPCRRLALSEHRILLWTGVYVAK